MMHGQQNIKSGIYQQGPKSHIYYLNQIVQNAASALTLSFSQFAPFTSISKNNIVFIPRLTFT
jgi:hypothetical protein